MELIYISSSGDVALVHYIPAVPQGGNGKQLNKREMLQGIRLFIKYCGVDVFKVLAYTGWSGGAYAASASVAHCAIEEYSMKNIAVLEPLQILLQSDCDLEERNVHSNTVLLAALSLVKFRELVPVILALLKAGAVGPLV